MAALTVEALRRDAAKSAPALEHVLDKVFRAWRQTHRLKDDSRICCQDALVRLRFDVSSETRKKVEERGTGIGEQIDALGKLFENLLKGTEEVFCARCKTLAERI